MNKASLSCLTVFISLFWVSTLFFSCETQKKGAASYVLEDIKNQGTLIVATAGNMPPLNMTADNGKLIGFEADLAHKFSEFLRVDTKFEIMPFSELLKALKDGRVHMIMSGMTITPERNVDVAFVGPYYVSSKALLTKEKSVVTGASLKSLNDPTFKFSALKGSTSQKYVETHFPEAQLSTADGYPEAVQLVIDDKVHALLADYPICVVSLLRYPEADFYTDIIKLTYEPIGIAIPADDPHLNNWLTNSLALLKANGTLQKIENNWFEDFSWFSKLP